MPELSTGVVSNRLSKTTNFSYVPSRPGSPGSPGTPPVPAYTVRQLVPVCVYSPGSYADAERRLLDFLSGSGLLSEGSITYSPNGYACTNVEQIVFVPSSPGTPAIPSVGGVQGQTITDFQLGWTGRANSVAVMTGPGKFSFRIPLSTIGAVVGLSANPQQTGYGDILFGFYVARGVGKIMESGVEVLGLGAVESALLEVRRTNGNIEYRVDDVLVRTRPNASTPLVLSASMYSGGDSVEDPSFEAFGDGGGTGVMRPFTGFANGPGASISSGVGVMVPFTGSGSARARGDGAGVMLPFKSRGGIAYGVGEGAMLPFTSYAEGLSVPSFSLASGAMQTFTGAATGLSGGNGEGAGIMQAFTGFAGQGARGSGVGVMSAFRSTVFNVTPADEVFAVSFADLGATTQTSTELFVVVNSAMQVTGLISVQMEYLAEVLSSMTLNEQIALDLEIEAMVQSLMRVGSTAADPRLNEASVYSMDIGGSTRYTNYDFNSFAQFDGAHYGAKADGIYLLQGADDAGQAIDARVNLGRPNMGSMNRKALPYVYVGAASNGTLILKVVADGRQYFYRASGDGDEVKTHRFTPGLGLRATNYELEIQNEGGEAFDLAEIEFVPVQLSRRI